MPGVKLSETHIYNERAIYKNYLIGLRKTKRLLSNATNIKNLNNVARDNIINNTQIGAKNLIMGNIVIDVSNVKEIHIKTDKQTLIIELDKKRDILPDLITNVNNIDNLLNTLSLLSKILNMN